MSMEENKSTFLIKSTKNSFFGTAFCIKIDNNGSYFVTCSHVVKDCGIDNLEINQENAECLHIGSKNGIDLAVVFVENFLDCSVLKLLDKSIAIGKEFYIDGFREHDSYQRNHRSERLNGTIEKNIEIHNDLETINTYKLSIEDGDSIKKGYSGSAIVCDGFVVAVATDRNTDGKQAYAIPIAYLKEIWDTIPKTLFQFNQIINPYKGLNSFGYEDKENYYGREEEAKYIANTLKSSRLFTLLGASGSGKSSLLFAGVVPLIEEDKVKILTFRPLDRPFRSLAKSFIPFLYSDDMEQLRKIKELSSDLLKGESELTELIEMFLEQKKVKKLYLIIDQFEELFTLTKDQEIKNRFLDQLIRLIDSKLKVTLILSLRVDFLSNISFYEPFNLKYNTYPNKMLSYLSEENLKSVIEKPALRYGITFQDGLVSRIMNEVKDEAGQLPLLEFALEQLWDQKENKIITHRALDGMKSISHSISYYADSIYEKYPKHQKFIKKIFIKLINPGMGTSDTRRIASLDDFDEELRETITLLATERLIVTKRDAKTEEIYRYCSRSSY